LHYFDGDMGGIRTYFEYRRSSGLDDFLVDDTTWNDLSGDDVFKRINMGLSTSGEQYLYYLLRNPAVTRDEYDKRSGLIEIIESDDDLRLKLQNIFMRLGRRRNARTCEVFKPPEHGLKRIVLYIFLVLIFFASAASLLFTTDFILILVGSVMLNAILHTNIVTSNEKEVATLNYSVAMVYAAEKIKKLNYQKLNPYLSSLYDTLENLKMIKQIGFAPIKNFSGEIAEFLNRIILLDLIVFELLKNRLGKHQDDIFVIHEYLGRLDSAIAVTSYRKSLSVFVNPQIDFDSSNIHFHALGLMHPLVESVVPNNLETVKPVLLTGSNASGKSTFLKTVALNAILAQSICTSLSEHYRACAFRIYSSMAITDNLLAEESYFISEIKSIRRIINTDTLGQPILCLIDEILRGTNTIERIAASSELLMYIEKKGILCIAATHDIELCGMLGDYDMKHFEETIEAGGKIIFDYKIKEGPATSRNAIKLLDSMGFSKEIVNRSNDKANRYTKDGKWI